MDTIIVRMRTTNVLVLMCVLSTVYCELCQYCRVSRIQGLRTADCFRKELIRVPQCLPRNIEVLDLSFNRIREISSTDLKNYPYLEILYLSDNILTEMHEDALDDHSSLHTVDVSMNAFYAIPKALFSLPVLRKLSLGGIRNRKMVEDIEAAVPITSPLIYLDLTYNKLERLPILGEVPSLRYYNVTGNDNLRLNTSMFAGLCNLEEFISTDCRVTFENPCDCHVLERWLVFRNVKFNPFNCEKKECSDEVPQEDLDVFNSCRKLHETQQQQLYTKKLLTSIGISVATVVGFLLVLLFFIFRRNKALKQKKKAEREAHKKQMKEVIDGQVLL